MAPPNPHTRVLIVDRDNRVRPALTALIDATPGLQVVTATSSLAKADAIVGAVDAEVAIVHVAACEPDDDLATVRRLSSHLPVVAVSAVSSCRAGAFAAGATAFCDEGVGADGLTAIVIAAAGGTS